MFCRKCGSKLMGQNSVCENCGASVSTEACSGFWDLIGEPPKTNNAYSDLMNQSVKSQNDRVVHRPVNTTSDRKASPPVQTKKSVDSATKTRKWSPGFVIVVLSVVIALAVSVFLILVMQKNAELREKIADVPADYSEQGGELLGQREEYKKKNSELQKEVKRLKGEYEKLKNEKQNKDTGNSGQTENTDLNDKDVFSEMMEILDLEDASVDSIDEHVEKTYEGVDYNLKQSIIALCKTVLTARDKMKETTDFSGLYKRSIKQQAGKIKENISKLEKSDLDTLMNDSLDDLDENMDEIIKLCD